MGNRNLHAAKRNKNDEFYTQIGDIEKEVNNYWEQFKGKTVYCNTDNYKESNFVTYFVDNFDKIQLKKLISLDLDGNYFEYDGEVEKFSKFENGDFRSEESIELLMESDIVCTNPPFSLFREYIAQLMEYEKEFIIIGNFNAVTYKEIFPLIKDNKIWLGYNSPKEFVQPDGSIKKFGNITWFTNIDVSKRHEDIFLYKDYKGNEDTYPKYDNYDAINIDRVKHIPRDYEGVMGVPITFLMKYNPEQFEILGMTTGRQEFSKSAHPIKRYINAKQYNKDGGVTNGSKMNTRATLPIDDNYEGVYYKADNADYKLRTVYARVLIKNKNPEIKEDAED